MSFVAENLERERKPPFFAGLSGIFGHEHFIFPAKQIGNMLLTCIVLLISPAYTRSQPLPPHRAQECLGVPVGFERWMHLTLIRFDWICDCYRDLGMAFSHLLRYIHLPQLDNMDKGLSAPCPPATTSCEVHGWAEEIPSLRMVFCWPFYLRCWSVDVHGDIWWDVNAVLKGFEQFDSDLRNGSMGWNGVKTLYYPLYFKKSHGNTFIQCNHAELAGQRR